MSLENRILEEEYILKLKELSNSRRSNYVNRRYELIVRYMVDGQSTHIFKNLPISDCYFQEIENYDQTPFIVKTDLFTELAELDKTNHGGLIDEIESLKDEFNTKLNLEIESRKDMNEGEKVERDQKMIAKFIEDYGYDPTVTSVMTGNHNLDGLDMDLSDHEEEESDQDEDDPDQTPEEEPAPKKKVRKITSTKPVESSPNGDLSFLNQILEITGIDFQQIKLDMKTEIEKPKKQTAKQKAEEEAKKKEEEEAKAAEEAKKKAVEDAKPKKKISKKKMKDDSASEDDIKKSTAKAEKEKAEKEKAEKEKAEKEKAEKAKTDDEKLADRKKEVNGLVDKAAKLVDVKAIKNKSCTNRQELIDAASTLADSYRLGDKLHKSEIKANLINLFLIKNYNDGKSMFEIGQALNKGTSILRNTKQGTKFIKVASESHEYQPATTALKRLIRQTPKDKKK